MTTKFRIKDQPRGQTSFCHFRDIFSENFCFHDLENIHHTSGRITCHFIRSLCQVYVLNVSQLFAILKSFVTTGLYIFLKIEQQTKEKKVLWLKANNTTFECGCTTKRFFSGHVFIKISYCIFKIMILKMKKNYKFFNLCSLNTDSFLVIWPSQYKFLTNEFLIKKCVCWIMHHLSKTFQCNKNALAAKTKWYKCQHYHYGYFS